LVPGSNPGGPTISQKTEHNVKASDVPFRKLYFLEKCARHISKHLFDLLTSYSTAVIFHLWNGDIEFTDEFERWWNDLSQDEQDSVDQMFRLLQMRGPSLGRPHADLIQSSRHSNMKELRVQHAGRPYRVLFAFDPKRCAILLTGGDKTGSDRWYEEFVPIADRLYEEHLVALEKEKKNNG
jgi:hypothetical protein